MRALIVDDEFYSRVMLHDMLRSVAECDIAVSGEEAVGAFSKALEDGRPYRLVCMDLVMPGMDGQQALRELRALEDEQGVGDEDKAVLLVVSMVEDSRETNEAFFLGGADSFLVKPIDRDKLFAELREHGLVD